MSDFDRQRHNYSQSERWSARGALGAQPVTAAEASVTDRIAFIRKVYALFFAATLFAIGGVLLGLAFPPLLIFAAEHPIIMFIVMIGGVMGAQAVRHVPGVNLAALFGFTTLTGVIISPVLYVIGSTNPGSILQAGVMTVAIFGGLTAYVFVSRRGLSSRDGDRWTCGVDRRRIDDIFVARSVWGSRSRRQRFSCLPALSCTTPRTSFDGIDKRIRSRSFVTVFGCV
jgi:FtsH-binding integral membrane protein